MCSCVRREGGRAAARSDTAAARCVQNWGMCAPAFMARAAAGGHCPRLGLDPPPVFDRAYYNSYV
jgi:hypothetical protein